MKKRLIALALSCAMVATLSVGCKKAEEPQVVTPKATEEQKTEEPAASLEPVEVEFWTMQLSPTFDEYLNSVIGGFQAENEHITVKWVDVPWGDMETRILAAAASGQMPDVVNLNPHFAQQLAQVGALSDMEVYAADVKDEYFKGAWEASRFEGKTFALPWYLTTGITFYNRELFEKAGLDASKAPATYEEVYEAAKAIKEKTGKFGFMQALGEQHAMEDFEKMGVRLFNEDYTKANFTSEGVMEGVKFFKRMMDEGLMPRESLTEGTGTAIQMYSAGEVALFQGGTSHAGMIESNNAEVYGKTAAGGQLLGVNGKINVAVMNIAVAEATENKEAAVKFATYLTNAQNQLEFAKISGAIIPSTKGSIGDAFFTGTPKDAREYARMESAKQIDKTDQIFPPIKNWSEIRNAFTEALQRSLVGDATPEEAFKAAEDKANALLAAE